MHARVVFRAIAFLLAVKPLLGQSLRGWYPSPESSSVSSHPGGGALRAGSDRKYAAHRPAMSHFMNAQPNVSGNRYFFNHDLVAQAAALPDGRVAVQVISGAASGKRASSLLVLSSKFEPEGAGIPTRDFGAFLGAARDGTLYFASFMVGGPSEVIRARLLP